MKLTSSVEYATRLMVRLAAQPPEATVTAEALAAAENIPRDFVDQLLLRLRRAGLVASRRGARGGYALAKPPAETSIGQIVVAVDHGLFESVCERYAEGDHMCTRTSECGIRGVWERLGRMVEDFLAGVTLAQLVSDDSGEAARVAALFASSPSSGREPRGAP